MLDASAALALLAGASPDVPTVRAGAVATVDERFARTARRYVDVITSDG